MSSQIVNTYIFAVDIDKYHGTIHTWFKFSNMIRLMIKNDTINMQ